MQFSLESFDDASEIAPRASPDYESGFAAGRAASTAETLMQQGRLEDELVQVLSDTAFSFTEAQMHVLGNLSPILKLVLEKILPATLSNSLALLLHDTIMEAAREDSKSPMLMAVSPAQVDSLQILLRSLGHSHLKLTTDSTLSKHAAFVSQGGVETVFDLDSVLAGITEGFAAITTPTIRRSKFGNE